MSGTGRVITNDFSWSKSRHDKFRECRRAYYLHYYRSWGGWEPAAPADVRQLYVLKKLHNRFTWSGHVVHEGIRRTLVRIRQGREVSAEREIDRAHRLMQNDFRFSLGRHYWTSKYRKEFMGLAEHEYGEPIPREEWKRNWDTAQAALQWFFQSRWIELARGLAPEQWLEVDEFFEDAVFHLEGVKMFAVPDFAYLEKDGTPVVVDWKTGQARDGYEDQVLGYSIYLSERYGFPAEKVRAALVYLNEGTEKVVGVDPLSLDRFRAHFRTSVVQMRELLADPAANLPRAEAAFEMTEKAETCRRCVFRRPCGREQVATSAPAVGPAQAAAV